MFLFFLLACTKDAEVNPVDDPQQEVEIGSSGEMVMTVDPSVVDFGSQEVGAQSLQVVYLYNDGDSDIFLADVAVTHEDDFTLTLGGDYLVPAGGSQSLSLVWEPSVTGEMSEQILLQAGTNLSELTEVVIPLAGGADGAQLAVSTQSHDFGEVEVGCSGELELALSNQGTLALTVDALELTYAGEFTLEDLDGQPVELPWTLGPGEIRDLVVRFAPTGEQNLSNTLSIHSDDPISPEVSVSMSGRGLIVSDNTEVFDVTGQQNVTVLMAVNDYVGSQFTSYVESFFATLLSAGPHFRVGVLVTTNGEVNGSVTYIDDSFSAASAASAARGMVEGVNANDNDYLFQTFQAAIPIHQDWLLDESDAWADSRLNLIGINFDQEQSSGSYAVYLNDFVEYKEDDSDVVVHAIGGDVPGGCNDNGLYAEAFTPFYDAANATGGTFLSYCEADWTSHMETLALACLGDNQVAFYLTGAPSASSLVVSIDGVEQNNYWDYNADLNAIVFDDGHFPDAGSVVSVYYIEAGECG